MKQKLHAIFIATWILALVVGTAVLVVETASGSETNARSATVKTSVGCSGVIVHGNLVLTAEHCQDKGGTLKINGRDVAYTVAYKPPKNGVDECVVLKLAGGSFRSVSVATVAPKVGDKVHTWGFPSGSRTYHEGKVTKIRRNSIETDFRVWHGHSGGPLFNVSGEVIGLASTRSRLKDKPETNWIRLSSIRTSLARVQTQQQRPVVYLFTWAKCDSCRKLKPHYAEMRKSMDLRTVEYGTAEFKVADTKYRAATGKYVQAVPTLWVQGTANTKPATEFMGDSGVNVLSIVTWVVKSAVSLIVGKIRERRKRKDGIQKIEDPKTDNPPTPIAESPADWSAVTLLLLIPKVNKDGYDVKYLYLRDLAVEKALSIATGPLRRRVDSAIGKSVGLVIVSERQNSARYAAVLKAAETTVSRVGIVVLVKKKDIGLLKGIAAKIALVKAGSKLEGAPVDVVFERTHGDVYRRVKDALLVGEKPEQKAGAQTTTPTVPAFSLDAIRDVVVSALSAKAKEKNDAFLQGVAARVEPKPESGVTREDVDTGLMATLIALVTGFGVTTLRKKSKP